MSYIHYKTHLLENGLRLIVHEDFSIPKTVLSVVYRVGARDEDPSRTGFAHLFEHLMFGGSKNIPVYDLPVQLAGGENNAYTNNDLTNYYISLPSNQIETGFWLESDRMLELDFSQKSLDVQKSVVIEEFKQRYLNRPYGDAHLLLRDIHFTTHPYRWSTIGKEISHIEGATLEDVKDFFFGFYAPNNATLVVAGGTSFEDALRLTEKWFGNIPRRDLKTHPLPQEAEQTEARSQIVHRDVPFASVYKMYHIPARTAPDYYAADILTDILSSGRASLLYQSLVKEKEIASSVRAFSWGMFDPGMISIDATLNAGKSVQEYEDALEEVLEKLGRTTEEELQRVKNMIESHGVMEKTTLMNIALSLGTADVMGDVELVNSSLHKFLSLSLDEVLEAKRKWVTPTNCSTLYYLPEVKNG